MGNLLTSAAQFDAARSASPSSEGAPVAAGPGLGPAPRTRPPSMESVEAAARAGIAGAAERRSSLPTRPAAMWAELGDEGRAFLRQCFRRLPPASLVDAHCHLAGQGSNDSGCYLSPSLRRPLRHPLSALKKRLFLTASGVSGGEADCDLRFAEVLAQLKRHCGPSEGAPHGRCHILALDEYYGEDGVADPAKTGMHVPNEWVWRVAAAFPDVLVPMASVHPYRKDALQQLQHWADKGARMIKWLPNAMGIDPGHPLCAPFYAAMRRLGLVLLSHTGVEHSVDFGFHDNALGNPLLLRAPLEAGVRVIAAHCASEGHAVISGHEALELGLVTGAAQKAEDAGSRDAGEADESREGDAGEGQQAEDEGTSDVQAFKRRKAAESAGAGSSAAAAAAGSKSADAASPDGPGIDIGRRGSLSRPSVVPTWLTSLLGFGGPAQPGLAIPSGRQAPGGHSRSSQSSSSRKRKLEHSSPVAAAVAAAAASPCPFSAISASPAHRTAGHLLGIDASLMALLVNPA